MRIPKFATLLAAVVGVMTSMGHAQTATTGQITGLVTDPSGAVVVGARLALTSDAGVRRETVTGSNGRYAFPLLAPGTDRLEASLSGFAPVKLQRVVVQITESTVTDIALKVAGSESEISVTGEAPLVQTETSARGTVIDQNQVRDLIISGGVNIYPAEIEKELLEHPAVAEVSVTGVTDEKWGEIPIAFVALKSGATASDLELIEFLRPRINKIKLPRRVLFIEALPRNVYGKVLKLELQNRLRDSS